MTAIIDWLGQRRKAIAALLGLAAETITQLIPQSNPQNALVLHSVLAVLTVWMVHSTPNDQPADTVEQFIEDLIHGDAGLSKHAAPAAPAPILAVPAPAPAPASMAG